MLACFETLEDRRMLSFSPAVNYATIGTPSAIVTADLNNDGKLDLVTCANAETGSISVFLGNGAGGFGAAQRTVIGSGLSSMAVADFNNDAKPDLVVSDYEGFRILMGNGDGTFQPTLHPVYKTMAAVGDFNNDGNVDVLATWIDGDWATHFQVYRGDGQGGFTSLADIHYWGWSGTAVADLNNDGKLDVVTGEGVVFLGIGDGSFQYDWERPAPLPGGSAVTTGDFTGDGNADAVVGGNGGSGNNVAVLRGTGDGHFAAPVHHSAYGTNHTAVATADFNADGKLDAIVTDADLGTVSVMLGNGDGTLQFFGAFATGSTPSGIVVGDFNHDGRADAAVANAGSRTVSVLLNDGNWQTPPPPPPVVEVSIADITVTEGDSGTQSATFTLTLSGPATLPAEVYYNAADISALAGSDYDLSSGVVYFAPGETTRTIPVAIRGDRVAEPTETFAVNLILPKNLRIADGQAIGTILDNDPVTPTKTFTGVGGNGSGGNWSNSNNWSPAGVPGTTDIVSIDAGKSVNLGGSATVAGLMLADGATLNVASNGNRVLRTASLNVIGTSKLNLNDNDLILDYSGVSPVGVWTGSTYDGVTGMIKTGRITSSLASGILTTLGVAEAREALGITGSQTATFAGESVDSTSVLVKFTSGGDANLDGKVNIDDYGRIDSNVAQSGSVWGWFNGDFNYDGKINIDDYGIIDSNIAAQGQPLLAAGSAPAVAASLPSGGKPEHQTVTSSVWSSFPAIGDDDEDRLPAGDGAIDDLLA